MEKDIVLETFLNFYPEEQRENVKQLLGDMTPEMYDLIVEIISKDEKDISKIQEKLSTIYMKTPVKQQLTNGQGIFSLFSIGNPEKSKEIISSVKELTDDKKEYIVFMTMATLIRLGKVPVENIDLVSCNDEKGIVLTAKLLDGKFLVATDGAKSDVYSPFGHWYTALFDSLDNADIGTYQQAIEYIDEIDNERMKNHLPPVRINHDCSIYEVGNQAQVAMERAKRK